MHDRRLIVGVVIGLAALWYWQAQKPAEQPAKKKAEPTRPAPKPEPEPKPKRPGPWGDCGASVEAKVAGPIAPDGTTIHVDLPGDQHCHNVSSRGEGCCTQTSVNHSARWQNVPALINFHKWVQEKGLPGGGHPGRMAERIPACAKDRGYPTPDFVQVENCRDFEVLKLACRSGRMPAVTYSKSPTGRYNGGRISHMVSMPHCDDKWIAILDNNYPGADKYEWMSPDEARSAGVLNWIVVLLSPPPPPPPK